MGFLVAQKGLAVAVGTERRDATLACGGVDGAWLAEIFGVLVGSGDSGKKGLFGLTRGVGSASVCFWSRGRSRGCCCGIASSSSLGSGIIALAEEGNDLTVSSRIGCLRLTQ